MTLALVQFTRTSAIDPFSGDPMAADIAYSGAVGAVTIKFGGALGPTVGTGPSGSATVSCTFPSYATAAFINSNVGVNGFFLDDGTTQIPTQVAFWPLQPGDAADFQTAFTVTPLGGLQFQFSALLYERVVADIAGPQAAPYDFWLDQPSMAFTPVLFTDLGGSVYVWQLSAPWTSLTWDFGDGNTATGASVTNTYAAPGIYDVSVTADYSPFTVKGGTPGRTGTHTIVTGSRTVFALSNGWHLDVIGMGQ